jgi:hypothetical protein
VRQWFNQRQTYRTTDRTIFMTSRYFSLFADPPEAAQFPS